MSEHTTEFQVRMPIDAVGRLTRDVECLSCGYNLRGALESGDCPECGSVVAESVLVTKVGHLPRTWLLAVLDGIDALILGFLLLPPLLPPAFVSLVSGVIRVTGPMNPRDPDVHRRLRRASRWMLGLSPLVLFAWLVVVGVLMFGTSLGSRPSASVRGLIQSMLLLAPACFFGGLVLSGVYVSLVARALGRSRLSAQLRWTAYGLGAGVLLVVGAVLFVVAPISRSINVGIDDGPLIVLAFVVLYVAGLAHAGALHTLRTLLRQALAERDRATVAADTEE